MRIAVVQHKLRATEQLDLAALLALTHDAAEDGARVIVCPCVPGLAKDAAYFGEFAKRVPQYASSASLVSPCAAVHRDSPPEAVPTPLGRTVILAGDECIDPALFSVVEAEQAQAVLWQLESESALQAEALVEYGIEVSYTLCGLVIVASSVGKARNVEAFGGSAIIHAGDVLAEAGGDEEIVTADVEVPVSLPERPSRPSLPPILEQRLLAHRGMKATPPYPADLG